MTLENMIDCLHRQVSRAALLTVSLLATLVPAAQAQDYPSRAIRLVVPTGPGGGYDVFGRSSPINSIKSSDKPSLSRIGPVPARSSEPNRLSIPSRMATRFWLADRATSSSTRAFMKRHPMTRSSNWCRSPSFTRTHTSSWDLTSCRTRTFKNLSLRPRASRTQSILQQPASERDNSFLP